MGLQSAVIYRALHIPSSGEVLCGTTDQKLDIWVSRNSISEATHVKELGKAIWHAQGRGTPWKVGEDADNE